MKLLSILGALLFSGIVAATPIRNIVVFGDSLSDNGNLYEVMKHQLPSSPPYFEGRFSNGQVWVEHLAAAYFPSNPKAHLADYAFGGAGVSEYDSQDDDSVDGVLNHLKKEIITYLSAHKNKASEDTLYILWIGANNYLGMPEEVEETIQMVNKGIAVDLERLVNHGAKHILVVNLPDLGRTPAAREFDSIDAFSYYTNRHNQLLTQSMVELREQHPDVNWIYYDMNTTFEDLFEHPDAYGLTNVYNPCVGSESDVRAQRSMLSIASKIVPQNAIDTCRGYLYFDLVHPTAYAHRLMAEKTKLMLDSLGLEFVE
jgi:phospholipase/lecithinase/hemolysin